MWDGTGAGRIGPGGCRGARVQGDDGGGAGDGIGDDEGAQAEHLLDHLGGDHLGRRAGGHHLAVTHHDQLVGVAGGLVEVVQHRDHGLPLLVEGAQQLHQLVLVGDVQEGRRLVQEHDRGLLREQHRDPHPLALPAGELVDQSARQLGEPGGLERTGHGRLVALAPLLDQRLVRGAAAGDEVRDADPVGRERGLREQAQPARDLLGAVGADRLPVQQHPALDGGEHACERPQQGRLAAAVGADDRGEGAVGDLHVEVTGDDPSVVADGDVLGAHARAGRRRGAGGGGLGGGGRAGRGGGTGRGHGVLGRGGAAHRGVPCWARDSRISRWIR
jgi:hypothetical protein